MAVFQIEQNAVNEWHKWRFLNSLLTIFDLYNLTLLLFLFDL